MDSDVVVLGGGAAGYFAAIRCAEKNPQLRVFLLEGSRKPLTKVKISGGGRCNVTHNCLDADALCTNYPRGHRELKQVFARFNVKHTISWFKERGVELRSEADGRMFSTTNRSQTIIDCLQQAARNAGVVLKIGQIVKDITCEHGFKLALQDKSFLRCRKLLIATGGAPGGHQLAEGLGHAISTVAPSLFTFCVEDDRLAEIPGLSVAKVEAKLSFAGVKKNFRQMGPVLITHWGLSGPCVLKLSAWAARELFASQYQAKLSLNWLPGLTRSQLENELLRLKSDFPAKSPYKQNPFSEIPLRLWHKFLVSAKIDKNQRLSDLSKRQLADLYQQLSGSVFNVSGKGVYKDEFVTCGGIELKELNFKTLESKIVKDLYFAGEILDIDGVTGGFNFQNAWSTGWIAGGSLAENQISKPSAK